MKNLARYSAFFLLLLLISRCKKDEAVPPPAQEQNTQNPPPPSCNDTLLPVVMMHGFLASGDTYARHFMRFTSNGYCGNRLFAYDWNTLGGGGNVNDLDIFIDTVLARMGTSQVNLRVSQGICASMLFENNVMRRVRTKVVVFMA